MVNAAPVSDFPLEVGGRIIHYSHGDGEIKDINHEREVVTVFFRDETSSNFGPLWRRLSDPEYDGPIFDGLETSRGMTVTVPFAKVFEEDGYWQVPKVIDRNRALNKALKRIREGEVTIDRKSLRSTILSSTFSRQYKEVQYTDRADLEEVIETVIQVVDLSVANFIRSCESKSSVAIRVETYERAIGRLGKNFWHTMGFRNSLSTAVRGQMEKILVSLTTLTTEQMDDEVALRTTAQKICRAIEDRVVNQFGEDIKSRLKKSETKILRGEWVDGRKKTAPDHEDRAE